MALSAATDDDDFEEYNAHPYRGGYDIALTYGSPLSPSSATCYPVSTPSSSSPLPRPPPLEKPAVPPPSSPPHAHTLPAPPYDYGLPENYQPEPFPAPDLFRSWPYSNWEDHQVYGGGWNGWGRALDYLFGHAQGYGERRVGVDSYGIPIYANKKLGGAESVTVEVEPAPVQRLECYDSSDSWPSGYIETTEKKQGYENPVLSYNRHYSEEALRVEIDPNESAWHQKLSYHEAYEDQDESDYMTSFFGGPGIAYSRHHYEQPLNVQVEPIETNWSQESSYSEVYQESAVPQSDWSSSYYGDREDQSNLFGNSGFAYERYSYEPADGVGLQPFKPSWSQNLGYYEVYEEDSLDSNWHYSLFGDQGDKTTTFENTNSSIQREYYELALSVQLEADKSTWFQNPSYYESHNEKASQIYDSGSDSLFYPFQNLLEYNIICARCYIS